MKHDFVEIENIIGYHFKNRELLFVALTHPSYANEHNMESYDRLEFVGDSILDFVIADELYSKYRHKDEGFLTKMRASIVSRDPLAEVVTKYKFLDYMLYGGDQNRLFSKKEQSNIFESLVAAIYYDGGLYESRKFILKFLHNNIENTKLGEDSKSLLQEYAQERGLGQVVYEMLAHKFEDNIHTYTMQAKIAGRTAVGQGKSKHEGEKKAAHKLLEALKS